MWSRAAVAFGGVALLGSLWLDWYALDESTGWTFYVGGDGEPSFDAWHNLAGVDVALAAIALVAIVGLLRPVAVLAVRVLGPVAVALVLWKLLTVEDGFTAAVGAYLALVAAVVCSAAAWVTLRRVA